MLMSLRHFADFGTCMPVASLFVLQSTTLHIFKLLVTWIVEMGTNWQLQATLRTVIDNLLPHPDSIRGEKSKMWQSSSRGCDFMGNCFDSRQWCKMRCLFADHVFLGLLTKYMGFHTSNPLFTKVEIHTLQRHQFMKCDVHAGTHFRQT